jgi:hypothetical protein
MVFIWTTDDETHRLVGSGHGDIQVFGLSFGEDRQFNVELSKMGTSDLLIEFLGEHVHAKRELLGGGPEGDLGKDLVSEGARHDERRVTSSTAVNDDSISIP